MITTQNLTKRFGDTAAVEDLTLRVDEGEVFGFLGPNGAGKTTTVRMLSCLISKTSGAATMGDYEVGRSADMSGDKEFRRGSSRDGGAVRRPECLQELGLLRAPLRLYREQEAGA